MTKPLAVVVACSLSSAAAWAQTPARTPAPAASPAAPKEVPEAPSGYSYNPHGRRDPFISLMKPIQSEETRGPKRPGIEGFLVQEVSLKGIVREPKGNTAMLLGPDGKSYFVKKGQKLYDGEVIDIDATSVTFRQQVTDPMLLPGQSKVREVKKTLYPSEEGRQ